MLRYSLWRDRSFSAAAPSLRDRQNRQASPFIASPLHKPGR
ncbi:hypothetical protein MTBSS4_570002 [Magnetospirillum sp. SS-4]|nr:hypothetical protein MTBSS4_570002 [Magnetospirillum sp. SS-4]